MPLPTLVPGTRPQSATEVVPFVDGATYLGGTASGGGVVIESTTHATKGTATIQQFTKCILKPSADATDAVEFQNAAGTARFRHDSSNGRFLGVDANGPALLDELSSATNPTLIPDRADLTAGIGGTGGNVSVIAGGTEMVRVTSAQVILASSNAAALVVGPNGVTNPTLQVDTSTTSAATGLKVTGKAEGSGVDVSIISSGTNEDITITPKGTGSIVLPSINDPANPILAFGDGDAGFYEFGDDKISVALGTGGERWVFETNFFGTHGRFLTNGPQMRFTNASGTIPIFTFNGDTNTGVGSSGSDELSLISNANECVRIKNSSTAGDIKMLVFDVDNGQMERVTVGAADSGGVGFKVLRIAN